MTLVVGLVLAAAVGHATWNAIAKAAPVPRDAVGAINFAVAVIGIVSLAVVGPPPPTAMAFAIGSSAIHVAYNLLLGSSLTAGELGQVYPLARGSAPLIVAIGALVLGHEHLAGPELTGVATVVAGIGVLARPRSEDGPRAVLLALATGATIAAYSLADGLGVRASPDPLAYAGLLFALEGTVVAAITALRRRHPDRRSIAWGLTAGVLSYATYVVVLWAQQRAPLAVVSALRETSVVIAALAGALLGERDWRRRLAAAAIVALGVVMVMLG
jgi:drug/metabolite transporter (DMT)-like permease